MLYDMHLERGISSISKYIAYLKIREVTDCCYMIDNLITDYDKFMKDITLDGLESKLINELLYNIIYARKYTNIKFTEDSNIENIKKTIETYPKVAEEQRAEIVSFVQYLFMDIKLSDIINVNTKEKPQRLNLPIIKTMYLDIFNKLVNYKKPIIGGMRDDKYHIKYLKYKNKYINLIKKHQKK